MQQAAWYLKGKILQDLHPATETQWVNEIRRDVVEEIIGRLILRVKQHF